VSHYKSNVRDQVFNLFEVFELDKALGQGEFVDLDVDTATEMLGEAARLCEGPVAASFVEGDRNPPVFDPETHSITLPESFKASVRAYIDGGWDKVGLIEELGGMPAPKALMWAVNEHVLGANPAVWMYAGGAGCARRRARLGFHHGADQARCRFGCRCRPDQGRPTGGRLLAYRWREAVHHLRGLR